MHIHAHTHTHTHTHEQLSTHTHTCTHTRTVELSQTRTEHGTHRQARTRPRTRRPSSSAWLLPPRPARRFCGRPAGARRHTCHLGLQGRTYHHGLHVPSPAARPHVPTWVARHVRPTAAGARPARPARTTSDPPPGRKAPETRAPLACYWRRPSSAAWAVALNGVCLCQCCAW